MSKNLDGKLIGEHNIYDLIHTATTAFNAMSEDAQRVVLDLQRHSWLKGEKALDPRPASRDYHLIETADTQQDINYYLARVEGQLARLEFILSAESHLSPGEAISTGRGTINAAKAFLASLRNALDPRRIDVV